MASDTAGRYQVVGVGGIGSILIDTETGRSWRLGMGDDWVPIPFKADAPEAPKK